MQFFRGLTIRKKQSSSSASAERRKKEENYYLQNGSAVLEEFLALCDENCRIPIRYFTATEIENAIKHSENKMEHYSEVGIVTGSLDNRLVLVTFNRSCQLNIYRDIAITAQMSHLKNVLRLVGCCLEFEEPVMVYECVESITLSDLLYKKGDHKTKRSLSWGKRLRIANEVASAIVFLHTEFTTPIIYRDIKPHKVIIDQNSGVAKIVDFSLSISLPPGELEVQDGILCGTFWYLDPEYASLGNVTQKTDVYSFGVLLLQLLTRNKFLDSMQSNIEEANAMDRVDSTTYPNPPIMVEHYIKQRDAIDISDPTLLEQHVIEIRQQLEDYLDLVKRCISSKGEDRPYMIHVARELRRIENCFRALTIGQN